MSDRERKGRRLVHGLKPHKKIKKAVDSFLIVGDDGKPKKKKKIKNNKKKKKSCLSVADDLFDLFKQKPYKKKKMKKADEGFLIVGDDYWKPKKKNRCLTVAYDLVVFQILSRLPVNTLMRFKSVCKSWKSIIVQDFHFMNLHYTHSKARPDRFAVQICNVSTGEVTPWITSSLMLNTMNRERRRKLRNKCYFGFDPTSGNFKVMFMWLRSPPVCEILTVGGDDDARFRIIDSVPPPPSCIPDIDVVVGNGGSVVYWFSYHLEELVVNRIQHEVKYSESLIAFDFGSEQFRIIPVPKFTEMEHSTVFPLRTQLIEMDGCPTVVRHEYGITPMITMWKFHGSSSSSSCSEEDWTKVEIRAPSHIEIKYLFSYFHSIPGKDLMILEAYDSMLDDDGSEYFARNVKFARLYFYDLKNKSFRKFKIEGISFLGFEDVGWKAKTGKHGSWFEETATGTIELSLSP
ncbi:hypothetical protein LINPERPRIM_LOCUS33905 [Linum perenne]